MRFDLIRTWIEKKTAEGKNGTNLFCGEVNISRMGFHNFTTGRSTPRLVTLKKMAALLGITLDELTAEEPKSKKKSA